MCAVIDESSLFVKVAMETDPGQCEPASQRGLLYVYGQHGGG